MVNKIWQTTTGRGGILSKVSWHSSEYFANHQTFGVSQLIKLFIPKNLHRNLCRKNVSKWYKENSSEFMSIIITTISEVTFAHKSAIIKGIT